MKLASPGMMIGPVGVETGLIVELVAAATLVVEPVLVVLFAV